MRIWNTLTRKKEEFRPIRDKKVGFYTCGPTVYNYAHIGNLRTYLFEDFLQRTLEANGYNVKRVMNVTDIEDKIIRKAREEKKTIRAVTLPYTKFFHDDLKKLNIERANYYPTATGHVKEIIALIKKILANGFAYKSEDGSVYFNVKKFKKYGALSELKKREIKIGARVSSDEYTKKEAQDFVLWKAAKAGEPSWPSPWGHGRPGWHVECSAMSMKYLGPTIDMHAGAVDLIFPHHENEIAQSEAATKKPFVRYWVHGEHLLVENQKMSKSLGNIFTLRDLINKGFDPLAYRYFVLGTHYRKKLNFTCGALRAAQNALEKLRREIEFMVSMPKPLNGHKREMEFYREYLRRFTDALNDDLNTPKAISVLWDSIKNTGFSAKTKLLLIKEYDKILGLDLKSAMKRSKIPKEVMKIARERELYRTNKQFVQSDALRKKIQALGWSVEDTSRGPRLRKSD